MTPRTVSEMELTNFDSFIVQCDPSVEQVPALETAHIIFSERLIVRQKYIGNRELGDIEWNGCGQILCNA